MQQLAYSVTQAKEFSDAARAGGDTTRALLAYYSITALANAEILWRGTGNDSFERRPSHFNGHGLELARNLSLWDFAARPLRRVDGSVSGLFGLWHRFASHFPIYCSWTTQGVTSQTSLRSGIAGTPLNTIALPHRPITLGECLKHIPAMQHALFAYGTQPALARGFNRLMSHLDNAGIETSREIEFIIHPTQQAVFEDVIENFKFSPAMISNVVTRGMNGGTGISIKISHDVTEPPWQDWSAPASFFERRDLYYMVGEGAFLNEFGYFYVGLYIVGMISRYYPQSWIHELREGSYITSLIHEFVDYSLHRVPMLVLGQLERTIFLYN